MKKSFSLNLILFIIFNTFITVSYAQIIQLVKEINTNVNAGSNPQSFTVCNNKLFFVAQDNSNIRRLWVTTGTEASTQLLGFNPSFNNAHTVVAAYNNELYFANDDGIHGSELWKSDGTVAGTVLLKDIYTGPNPPFSAPEALTVNNGKLFFDEIGDNGLINLYMTDGTAAGTVIIKEAIRPAGIAGAHPILGADIYFSKDNLNGTYGLWKTDGTTTVLVKDNILDVERTGWFAVMNNKLYLNAVDVTGTEGSELWVTDGTTAGTHIVINLSTNSGNPKGMTVYNNKLYFSASDDTHGEELFATDGTEAGTYLVKDILAGTNSSLPRASIVYNGFLYFSTTNTNELWKTDGTEAGTVLVKNTFVPLNFAAIWNGKMYLADGQNIIHLQESDGTSGGTKDAAVQNVNFPIDAVYNQDQGFNFTEYNSDLYFAGRCFTITGGYEPVRLTMGGALPLRFLLFNVRCNTNTVTVTWKTAEEFNTGHFEIQRTTNGNVWTTIGKLPAARNSASEQTYFFTDNNPLSTTALYRLAEVDLDGKIYYTSIIRNDCSIIDTWKIWPNPVQEQLFVNISVQANTKAFISIFDTKGALIKQQSYSLLTGNNQANIDMRYLSAGTYNIVAKWNNDESVKSVMVIKQ